MLQTNLLEFVEKQGRKVNKACYETIGGGTQTDPVVAAVYDCPRPHSDIKPPPRGRDRTDRRTEPQVEVIILEPPLPLAYNNNTEVALGHWVHQITDCVPRPGSLSGGGPPALVPAIPGSHYVIDEVGNRRARVTVKAKIEASGEMDVLFGGARIWVGWFGRIYSEESGDMDKQFARGVIEADMLGKTIEPIVETVDETIEDVLEFDTESPGTIYAIEMWSGANASVTNLSWGTASIDSLIKLQEIRVELWEK